MSDPSWLSDSITRISEHHWLSDTAPEPMLQFLRGKASERKLRLFAVACCRDIWNLISPAYQKSPEVAEAYAEGLTGEERLRCALAGRCAGDDADYETWQADAAAGYTAEGDAWRAASNASEYAAWAAVALESRRTPGLAKSLVQREQKKQAALLRHIFGNPFRPHPAPLSWPSTVVQLAESLYAGQDCAFALHDALLEAGHVELAEHFREEKSHPKGCWAMDVILGKE
jgi:hypothetical protein